MERRRGRPRKPPAPDAALAVKREQRRLYMQRRREEAKARCEAAGFTGEVPMRTREEVLEDKFAWMRERMKQQRHAVQIRSQRLAVQAYIAKYYPKTDDNGSAILP